MSHTIYTADAIVLHRVSTGEADVTLWLLTAGLGLVVVKAQGVRKDVAKMRAHLQLFSLLRVSLVRGKYVWRVTGTESIKGDSLEMVLSGGALTVFARIAVFLRRMMLADSFVDSQSTLELFETVRQARQSLAMRCVDRENIEIITIAKILASLGYVDTEILKKVEMGEISQNELTQVVNNAITESHL